MNEERYALWDAFLEEWPPERVRSMSLDEYTNLNRSDAFVYWLEKMTEKLGSIWGGSAFKWGIYKRNAEPGSTSGTLSDDTYSWYARFGESAEEAFHTIRERLVHVIEAAQQGDLARIDSIDVCWPMVKWKVAFLYQPQSNPSTFPMYGERRLLAGYKVTFPDAEEVTVNYPAMYPAMLQHYAELGDVFSIAAYIDTKASEAGAAEERMPESPSTLLQGNDIQYWKISPGENAYLWNEWKEGDYIAIGWGKLGDISQLDRAGFNERLETLRSESGYEKAGPAQVWRFRQIPVGSRVIANQGMRKILGIGTVVGPYEYHPEAGNYCHRLPVRWDDVAERTVNRRSWSRTLIRLTEAVFLKLMEAPVSGEFSSENEPALELPINPIPDPQSIILFGPPGTGKTWNTTTRALQLIYPEDDVASWSDEERAEEFRELQRQGRIEFVTFHQSYGYEEFVEGIRPVLSADASEQVRYELHPGAFKRISLRAAAAGLRDGTTSLEAAIQNAQAALDRSTKGGDDFRFNDQTEPYVLIIDEINRGNVSKILGELITLLEADKRLGGENELRLPLAYSPQHRFAVPPNLHIIGTMNTADRSIALMDVALRRRFQFEEMLPQRGVIRHVLEQNGVQAALVDLVCDVFETVNARIRHVLGRDQQIGHAYFLNVRSLHDLRNVFADRVIPLLQEYFYGSWERVCLVLGCPYDEDGTPLRNDASLDLERRKYRAPMIVATAHDSRSILGFVSDEYGSMVDMKIAPRFRPAISTLLRDDDRLVDYFLGILPLDALAWESRKRELSSVDAR